MSIPKIIDRISDCKGSVILSDAENSMEEKQVGLVIPNLPNLAGRANNALSKPDGGARPVTEGIKVIPHAIFKLKKDSSGNEYSHLLIKPLEKAEKAACGCVAAKDERIFNSATQESILQLT